jgi:hypothetical protein
MFMAASSSVNVENFYLLPGKTLNFAKTIYLHFFEVRLIQDPEEIKIKCPGQISPIYEFIPQQVPEKILAQYPFVKTQEDRDQIAQNFIIFDAVEANFIQIMSEKGSIPKHSETYHKTIILMHALSITLWGYMFVWTAAMTCGF